jgi:DNA-binding SARP family transcriptional activator
MKINVLGPFAVSIQGRTVRPTAAKQRTLLALLAMEAGRVVPTDVVIEELWGDRPPRSSGSTLRTYVLQVRRLIAAALPAGTTVAPDQVLRTETGGYLLEVPRGDSDADAYERAAAAGHRAFAAEDHRAASQKFTEALAMWRGPMLVDVKKGLQLEADASRMHESRLNVMCRRIEADLRLGKHYELLAELAGLCAKHPLHEGLHTQLMLALYRCDRRSDALAAYQRLRTAMIENLGLEPSPRLRQLHRSLLLDAPELIG